MKNILKISTATVLAMTVVLSIIRSACMLTSYDTSVRYFERGFLPTLHTALYFIGAIGCLATLLFLRSRPIFCYRELSKVGTAISLITATTFMICGILLAMYGTRNSMKLEIYAGLLAMISALFFFFSALSYHRAWKKAAAVACPWLCIPTMATLILLLASTYFDMTTTINGPFTPLFLFSALCGCIFFLCEMRGAIGRPAHRLHFVAALTTALLAVSSSIGNLTFCFFVSSGAERAASDPLRHLILLSVGLYAVVRLFHFSSEFPVKNDEDTPSQTEFNENNQQIEK